MRRSWWRAARGAGGAGGAGVDAAALALIAERDLWRGPGGDPARGPSEDAHALHAGLEPHLGELAGGGARAFAAWRARGFEPRGRGPGAPRRASRP